MVTQVTVNFWAHVIPTSSYTVSLAEGILVGMMKRIYLYQAHLVHRDADKSLFHVTYSGDMEDEDNEPHKNTNIIGDNDGCADTSCNADLSPIPLFLRTRIVTIDASGVMFCSCRHFERIGLPCVHQASVASRCHSVYIEIESGVQSVFAGFTHHDISVRWWSQYLYYAYQPMTPSIIVQQFHSLSINPIKGPRLRCNIPSNASIQVSWEILPAIYRLKNYPKNSFTFSQLQQSVMSQCVIHLSQTSAEDDENELFNYMNSHLSDFTGGSLNDTFSDSIRNSDFRSPLKEVQVMARHSLKQLLEECCTEADALGFFDGVSKLEDCLKSFMAYANTIHASRNVSEQSQHQQQLTKTMGDRVPMTHGKYQGRSQRVFNTHNYY